MTVSRKYRRGTSYRVSFPTAPSLTAQPGEVELRQEKGSHDVLILEYERSSSLWFEVLKTGTPVVFTWNQDGKGAAWAGYVNIISKQSASQKQRKMKIICVGTSFVLKAKSTRVFKNSTITEAAEKIAKEFNFKFIGDPTSRRFESLALAGQSYWEWLQDQASRIGYVMLILNGTMYFRQAEKLVDSTFSTAAVLSGESPGLTSNRNLYDRTLDSFTILNGDYVQHSSLPDRTSRLTAGINPLTGALTGYKSSPGKQNRSLRQKETPALFTSYSTEVVHTRLSAQQAADEESRARRFSVLAKVIGQGDAAIHPYATVLVTGTGEDTDGYWVTSKATHLFKIGGEYQLEAEVMSDGLGRTRGTPLRRADGSGYATVNLSEAVVNMSQPDRVSASVFRLITKVPVVVESQQGFVQLGSIWSGK
jgi:phage protein D